MATIDLGKIKLVWRGTYNASTAYAVDDLVEYTDTGILSAYICTTASQGNAPSSGGTLHSSWDYIAKGSGTETGSSIATKLNGQNVYTTGNIGRDSTDYFSFTDNTQIDVYVNGSNEFRFEADGDFHADGDVIAVSTTVSSDKKLKENIEKVSNALEKIEKLNGVLFDWIKTGEKSAGVIAQDVQEVLPQAVKEVKSVSEENSYLAVNYNALTCLVIEAIKELKLEIEQLKGGK